jgi:hypothetical protein
MPGHGGRRPGSGRKPGSPNKISTSLKEMILQALDAAGGPEYLKWLSKEHPPAFATLLGKVCR